MAAKKKRSILITGVPGTGKSTVASLVAKKTGAALIDINKLVAVLKLYDGVDERDGAKIARLSPLSKELSSAIGAEKRSVIIEGHLGCEMRLPVLRVAVLRCEPGELRRRLSGRGYPDEKVAKNALSEALDYCTVMAEKNYGKRKVWEMDSTKKNPQRMAEEICALFSGKRQRKARVSWPDALAREAISWEKIRKPARGLQP